MGRTSIRYLVYFACLALALPLLGNACAPVSRPISQTQLQAPGLLWLSALSRLPAANGAHGGRIWGAVGVPRSGDSDPNVLLTLDNQLHLVGLDGKDDHTLDMGGECDSEAILTHDSKWVMCTSDPGGWGDFLLLASFGANGAGRAHEINLLSRSLFWSLTWSPDDQYLAVGGDNVPGRFVAIFSSPPPHTKFTLLARLTSDQFSDPIFDQTPKGPWSSGTLSWSADGNILRVLVITQTRDVRNLGVSGLEMVDVDVTSLLASAATTPITMNLPDDQFHAKDSIGPAYDFAWNPSPDTLAYMSPMTASEVGPETLHTLNLQTGAVTDYLPMPETHQQISSVEWMPDGHRLLVVVSESSCVDCGTYYLDDVYLYTPPIIAPIR